MKDANAKNKQFFGRYFNNDELKYKGKRYLAEIIIKNVLKNSGIEFKHVNELGESFEPYDFKIGENKLSAKVINPVNTFLTIHWEEKDEARGHVVHYIPVLMSKGVKEVIVFGYMPPSMFIKSKTEDGIACALDNCRPINELCI